MAAIHSYQVVLDTGKNKKVTASECIMEQYKKKGTCGYQLLNNHTRIKMNSLCYSNGFIDVVVDIDDDDVIFHVSNYLIAEEKKTDCLKMFKINAFLKKSPYSGMKKTIETQKGEYGESIISFEVRNKKFFYNEDNQTTFYWDDDATLMIFNEDKKGLFIDTYRAIRQMLIGDLLNRGGVVIHSSSIYIEDKGYLFVGNKRAGKTTSLFQYLNDKELDVYYGSNERTILLENNGKIFMYGWPGTAFVGVGTIKSTIGLKTLYDVHKRAGDTATWLSLHQLTNNEYINELINMGEEAYDIQEKIWLTSKEISFLVDKKIKNYGYLDKVIWPNLIIGEEQRIKKVQKSLEDDVIIDLDFFIDWLGIRKEEKTESKQQMLNKLLGLSQYEISGENLVARIDKLQ